MREIKFRAWLTEAEEMWYDVTYNHQWDYTIVDGDWEIDNGFVKLMQFVGYKDINKKDIYEGDIVKCVSLSNDHNQRGSIEYMVIRYFGTSFCLCFDGYESGTPIFPLIVNHELTVVGNIYENTIEDFQ